MKECTERGFENGGWFIFTNPDEWRYRANEFSNQSLDKCYLRLVYQAKNLRSILSDFGIPGVEISFSLEIVHGIWSFGK